ncbi:LysR substrate-binding domain-containing protein [soil metagenome]
MDLRQLEYFVAVAEEANFTRAAERVHISQSGVSAQVRQLERELGAELIDRSGRTATLTAAGAAALRPARDALSAAEAVRQAVDDVNGLVRGRLEIGMVVGCTIAPLFDGLATFHRAHPGVEIGLVEDGSDRLVERVRTGATDLALIGVAGTAPEGIETTTISSEGLVALVASDHPLARRRRATLAQVLAGPVVCLPPGTGIRSAFDQACEARGLVADLSLEASSPEAVADLAARGFGAAVLAETMAVGLDHLHPVAITDADVPALLVLAWRSSPHPALHALRACIHDAFGLAAAA